MREFLFVIREVLRDMSRMIPILIIIGIGFLYYFMPPCVQLIIDILGSIIIAVFMIGILYAFASDFHRYIRRLRREYKEIQKDE